MVHTSVTRRLTRRSLAAAVLALAVATGPGPSVDPPPPAEVRPVSSGTTAARAEWMAGRVLELVNERRARHGLRPLRLVACVDGWSEDWATRLERRDGYTHSDLGGLLDRCEASYAAENLARMRWTVSPRRLVRRWMRSPEHRHNILSPHARTTGVALRWDPDVHRWLAVQDFSRRL